MPRFCTFRPLEWLIESGQIYIYASKRHSPVIYSCTSPVPKQRGRVLIFEQSICVRFCNVFLNQEPMDRGREKTRLIKASIIQKLLLRISELWILPPTEMDITTFKILNTNYRAIKLINYYHGNFLHYYCVVFLGFHQNLHMY